MIVTWLILVGDADFGLTAQAPCPMSGQEGFMHNVSEMRFVRLILSFVRIFALIIFAAMITLMLIARAITLPGAVLSTCTNTNSRGEQAGM